MADPRPRIRVRISQNMHDRLVAKCLRPDMSQSKIVEQALLAYFCGEVEDARDAALLSRLDHMSRASHRLERDLAVMSGGFSLFVQYFLTMMPDIPAAEADVKAKKGELLYNEFLLRLGDVMSSGGRTIKNALEDVMVTDADYVSEEDIAALKSSKQTEAFQ